MQAGPEKNINENLDHINVSTGPSLCPSSVPPSKLKNDINSLELNSFELYFDVVVLIQNLQLATILSQYLNGTNIHMLCYVICGPL